MDLNLNFSSELWVYSGEKATWYFVTLPQDDAQQIRFFTEGNKRGWGSVRVSVRIGTSTWKTSVFPDSKSGTYILPIKAAIRKAEDIDAGDQVDVNISVIQG